MPYTSPYQKMVTIHRAPLDKNFLGINNDSWKTAARILTPPSFLLYIYFASNKDKFTLALSPKAIQQEIGMARSTFYDQVNVLESLGYLVRDEEKKSGWHFYERPACFPDRVFSAKAPVYDPLIESAPGIDLSACGQEYPQEDREIYNKSSHKEDKYILPGGKGEEYRSAEDKPKKIPIGFDF